MQNPGNIVVGECNMVKIIFFGDSLSADGKINGCKATTPGGKVWTEIVPYIIGAGSSENHAICGSRSHDLESQIDRFIKKNPEAKQYQDTVFYSILIGGNNVINLSWTHFVAGGLSVISAAWLAYLQIKIPFSRHPLKLIYSSIKPLFISVGAGIAMAFGITFNKNEHINKGIELISIHTDNNQNNKFIVLHLPNMNKIPLGSNIGNKVLDHVIMPNYKKHVGSVIESPVIEKAFSYALAPFIFNLNMVTDITKTVFNYMDYWMMKYQIASSEAQIAIISLDNLETAEGDFFDPKHPSAIGHQKMAEFIGREINALVDETNKILYGLDSSSVD